MTAPGKLDRRLVLQAPVENGDGAGGVTRSYATVTTLWAQLAPVAMRAEVAADALGASLRYRIVIRYRNDVTTRHRFQDGAQVFRILAARASADRRFLEIDADVQED